MYKFTQILYENAQINVQNESELFYLQIIITIYRMAKHMQKNVALFTGLNFIH